MKKIFQILFSITLFFAHKATAQSFDRYVISSTGTSATFTNGSMDWTIGEVMMETYYNTDIFFTQGFHQPSKYVTPIVTDFFIPEGFSPNGDKINDPFFIRGLHNFPNNSITIYNRWGDKVFEASPYANNWYGKSTMGLTVGGDDLPVGTYFYLFNKGDGSDMIKGTIYLNR